MKKLTALLVLALTLVACGSPKVTTAEHEYKYTDSNGAEQTIFVDVTLEDGKIKEISIDETYGDSTKKALGTNYGMSAYAGTWEWDVQIGHLEKALVGTDGKIALDENGYPTDPEVTATPDAESGCTVGLTEIQKAILEAIAAAK